MKKLASPNLNDANSIFKGLANNTAYTAVYFRREEVKSFT